MTLKPQNVVQAAEADMKRALRNAEQAAKSKQFSVTYEEYAFHRDHVRRAFDRPHALILMALMDPVVKTKKANTKLLYGNAGLLLQALRLTNV